MDNARIRFRRRDDREEHAPHHFRHAAERSRRPEPCRRTLLDPRLQHRIAQRGADGRPLRLATDLVTTGSDAVIQQISNQLLKLVDVVDVEDVTREEHFERELLLIKVKGKATQVGSLWSATQRAGGRVLWDAADSFTIELTSNEAEINRFIAEVVELRRGARGRAQRRARNPEGQGGPGVVTPQPPWPLP